MSHIYYELYYHVVWATKRRMNLIAEDVEEIIKERSLPYKIKQLGGQLLEFNNVSDHCHLLVKIPPKISISDFVGQLKGYISHDVNKIKGDKCLEWQEGFGVLSLSKKGLPFVRNYIKNQKAHHKNNTVLDILELTSEEGRPPINGRAN